MLRLEPIGLDNWREPLEVYEEQRHFVSDPDRILARAYAYREQRSQAKLILDGGTPVGMLMWYDYPEQERYVFSQLLIDKRYQRRGFGVAAARLALDEMRSDGRYPKVVLCYITGNEAARTLYEKLGFRPVGEPDGDENIMVLDRL